MRAASTGGLRKVRALGCAARHSGGTGGVPCTNTNTTSKSSAFEVTGKRRKGFPTEARLKRCCMLSGRMDGFDHDHHF